MNSSRYARSEEFLKTAEAVIPLGSQTYSKSKTQLPYGVSPFFADRGEGPYLYDIDGNKYIDYVCSLGAITLGYCDPDIDSAVSEQLKKGVIFSLPSKLEAEVAQAIVDAIPCAEMVRFGKNGSDATAGAVRLARAYTGRERIVTCGYHGWQDWYIGTTSRNLGVPETTRTLTHPVRYNDLDAVRVLFETYPNQIAAIIMEPINFEVPKEGYLADLKALCHQQGALLVFDEVVTGFRYPSGSAQAYLGVEPDLVTLGKGLANGYPLSAVAGRAEIMKLMEEIFFSFTMGGEALSLAAAKACLNKIKSHDTLRSINARGTRLQTGFRTLIKREGLTDVLSLAGDPSWSLIGFRDQPGISGLDLKTLFMQECFRRGIFNIGLHFISYAHTDADIDATLDAYGEIFPILKAALASGDVKSRLECSPLVPLFKVR